MTTKPKAKKYRIRRSVSSTATPEPQAVSRASQADAASQKPQARAVDQIFASSDDGFGGQTFPSKAPEPGNVTDTQPSGGTESADSVIAAIKREGLTGRQLRMARRVAQKQGLSPTSDYDAVRLLREQGIDPFKRSNMLELVVPDSGEAKTKSSVVPQPQGQVPSTQVQESKLPSTQVLTEGERTQDIMEIQRDIARRRRKRAMLLLTRLAFFVFLPTIVAGYYFYAIATPMFATKSEFVIQQAEPSGGGQLGSLFSGTGFANSQDSITVQGYLQSRDAMLRLDEDAGFRAHFSQPQIDALQRLETDSSNEDAYDVFRKRVRIGFDPTEGVIKMEVSAADPATSADFSKRLIGYAEEQVDQLTARLRSDQMEGAERSRQEAEAKMVAAQQKIVELQEKLGVLSPESEVQAVFGQITQLESELLNERLSLQQFLANARPNEAKVSASRNKIAELEKLIEEKRAQLTESSSNSGSLARISGELLVAQADLETRQGLLAQAEAQFEAARLEANRQVRYLSVGVSPVSPDEATYPRAFENTILAFLIFSGIYLMVSLTASILREQV